MTRQIVLAAAVATAVLATGGCTGIAIREGLGATGGSGVVTPISPPQVEQSPSLLAGYQRFELEDVKDDTGGTAPAAFFAELPDQFAKALRDKKILNSASGKTLLIRGKLTYYETSSGMVDAALGPFEEAIARIEFVDKASGKALAVADCIGRTNANTNKGAKYKAQGMAKAFAEWISKNFPKSERLKSGKGED
jgi:hypothetical protein